jgi:glycosyltransferase involved in cell wall biosynthesis
MVTVIIPCHNAATSIRRCLDSVLGQTRKPDEIIVVNDGSTDTSVTEINSYGGAVQCMHQANQGPSIARNTGVNTAKSKYIAFLDADDFWMPEFLEKCVHFLESHPEAIAVSTGQRLKLWGHADMIRPVFLAEPHSEEPVIVDDFFKFWGQYNHITTGSVVFHRCCSGTVFNQLPDLRMCEDLELWGYLATFGKWGFVPEVLFVSDGANSAVTQGWFNKHSVRWRFCPTIEQWQRRIEPRLTERDWPGFRVTRGWIVKSLAHASILAGRGKDARGMTMTYGKEFPIDKISCVLKFGAPGSFRWALCCSLLRFRERVKAITMAFTVKRKS